ncbi:unnamed protein product [Cylindrotheca closterium]|uniref:Uncharacterized protein n=1 Tax=Cylindrotheca closterium TaxID=2856 RepID=A0AAD2G8R7_9STRA|nr:unnamed protein product [Cylindrotheca closterium]
MGMVFGKTGVAEPVYETLFLRSKHSKKPCSTEYEIRKYATRYAIETDNSKENNAFRLLAGYIGVGGPPQNEGSKSIAMTAPVATTTTTTSNANSSSSGTQISMTAPVVSTNYSKDNINSSERTMQFYLPSEFDSMDKIPKPSDSRVRIKEVPPETGAVHTFSGSMSEEVANSKVTSLVEQLQEDGLDIAREDAMKNYLLWQFNPPFTIPSLRRNEIWIPLTVEQVKAHLERFSE